MDNRVCLEHAIKLNGIELDASRRRSEREQSRDNIQ